MANEHGVPAAQGEAEAREFAWLTPEREDLFSPASSAVVSRLLPYLLEEGSKGGKDSSYDVT